MGTEARTAATSANARLWRRYIAIRQLPQKLPSLSRKRRRRFRLSSDNESRLNEQVLTLDVAMLAETLPEAVVHVGVPDRRREEPDLADLFRRLGLGSERASAVYMG